MTPILRAFIFSNCWVALCFATLCLGIAHHYALPHLTWIGVFAFCGTFASYHLHRMIKLPQLSKFQHLSDRIAWLIRHQRTMNVLFGMGIIGAIIAFFQFPINIHTLLPVGIVGAIILLYAMPLPYLPYGLRSIPGTKIFWITACWTLVCCLPFFFSNTPVNWRVITIVSLTVFAQIIPFDIRDHASDNVQMKTIPQLFGIPAARIIAISLISIACTIYAVYNEFHFLLFVYWFTACVGFIVPIKRNNHLILELFWEFPLLVLGLLYYFGEFR